MLGNTEPDAQGALRYPDVPHRRRHGPRGYVAYVSYKPWLRDEFFFRCVYCLTRERWVMAGSDSFGVDHVSAQRTAPERRTDYDNLVYSCCRCNAFKQDQELLVDPCAEPLGKHLLVREDGTVQGLTREGIHLIGVCALNRANLLASRRRILKLFALLANPNIPGARVLLREYLGFPDDLPELSALRPPGGNTRPEGIAESCWERKRRGALPETY